MKSTYILTLMATLSWAYAQSPAIEGVPVDSDKQYEYMVVNFTWFPSIPAKMPSLDYYNQINLVSLNAVLGISARLRGFEVGGFGNIETEGVVGFQAAGALNAVRGPTTGIQLAGAFNLVSGDLRGAQLAGAINLVRSNTKALQMAGASNIVLGEMRGVQLAGASNVVLGEMRGVQIAGAVNYAHTVNGLQVGAFNFAQINNGLALGWFSHARNMPARITVYADEAGVVNFGVKSGVKPGRVSITTMFTVSTSGLDGLPWESASWTSNLWEATGTVGIGVYIPLSVLFFELDWLGTAFVTDSFDYLNQGRFQVGLQLRPRFALVGGVIMDEPFVSTNQAIHYMAGLEFSLGG
ncbi:MAG: hypothetical protein IH971_01885 [Candidatus Marinimicrobia bacterium]|nr:hypothetical protein [Candidatus Neomarinimicrobiota bacterium]